MKRIAFAASAAVLLVLLASCSSSSNSTTAHSSASAGSRGTSASATSAGIVISGMAFSGTMTVKPGAKVTVTNKDSVAHTLTDKDTHMFDTGNIDPGATGTFTAPTKAGSYPFGCKYHPNMHGALVVTG